MHRIPVVLLVFMGACDATSPPNEVTAAGVVVEDSVPRWRAQGSEVFATLPEAIIGQANGPPEYALSNVVGAAQLSDGRIVIANRGTNELRYYDAQGVHARTTGRHGDGPGEFRWIDAIRTTGDTVLVWDAGARRVSRFDGSGTFVESTSLQKLEVPFAVLAGFLDDGSMLLRPRSNFDKNGDREGEVTDSMTYLRFSSRSGEPMATVGPFLRGEMYWATANRHWMSGFVIFGNRGLEAGSSTGFYRAETNHFEATFYTPDGTPVRTIRRPYEPVRASGADIAAAKRKLAEGDKEMLQRDPDMAPVRRRLLDNLPHRSALPAISQIRVDRQDNLWIRAYVPPDAEIAEWSVFDPEGHWLGVVEIPADLEVLEIGDDYLLAKTVDPLDDVERVVLHRLRKPR